MTPRVLWISTASMAILLGMASPAVFAGNDGHLIRVSGSASEDRIAETMESFVTNGEISGAVTLVAKDGKVLSLDAVGLADLATKQPMRPDTMFAIASMTKPITSTALMMLVDEGKVSLDDPISKYVPEFKNVQLKDKQPPSREITLRDLLTHTSGLGGSQANEGTLAETAAKIAGRPLSFEPGEKWQYSPAITVIGRVVEVVSGKPYEVFLQERLFEPLGMKDTTFHPNEAQQERIAKLYNRSGDGPLTGTDHWISKMSPERTPNPSAGLFSTAGDLFRFYQMILNGGELNGQRFLSEATVKEMTKEQTRPGIPAGFAPGHAWGYGWGVVKEPQGVTSMLSPGTFGHGGAFGTQGWIDPERKMVYVMMIQRTGIPNSDASAMRKSFQQAGSDLANESK